MTSHYCTFELGELHLGIEVERVQEVWRGRTPTPVPLAPPAVAGLVNLRGQIVTAIDLRRRMALPARDGAPSDAAVVLRTPDGAVALLVDELGDVVPVDAASVQPVPPTVAEEPEPLLAGVVALPERLLLVLDVERVLAIG